MIEFSITTYCEELDDNDNEEHVTFRKKVSWPALPRVGEIICIVDDLATVRHVYHWMDTAQPEPWIEVELDISANHYNSFLEEPGWERT